MWESIAMGERTSSLTVRCPYDGHEFEVDIPEPTRDQEVLVSCPHCAVALTLRIENVEHTLKVEGSSANEVKQVSESLVRKTVQSINSSIARNHWISGSFYLFALILLLLVFLVVANTVNFVVLPIAIVSGLLAVTIVGAFQLRREKNLSEKEFVKLMELTFNRFPFIWKKGRPDSENQ